MARDGRDSGMAMMAAAKMAAAEDSDISRLERYRTNVLLACPTRVRC